MLFQMTRLNSSLEVLNSYQLLLFLTLKNPHLRISIILLEQCVWDTCFANVQKENFCASLPCQIHMATINSKLGCLWKLFGRDQARICFNSFPPSKFQRTKEKLLAYLCAIAKLISKSWQRNKNSHYGYRTKNSRRVTTTLRAEPPFVFFFTEEEKRRLCPNRVNSLKPPQPELLD